MKLPEFFRKKEPEPRRLMSMDPEREYWRGSFFGDIIERLRHRGERITVEIWQKMETLAGKTEAYYARADRWTQASSDELHKLGFLPGVRVPGYDAIQWWRQDVYVRVLNYEQFNVHVLDDSGNFVYPQDTPNTLHDEMNSNATKDFIKAMFKTTLPTMDVQKIIMIGILAVGAIFGLMMMGII